MTTTGVFFFYLPFFLLRWPPSPTPCFLNFLTQQPIRSCVRNRHFLSQKNTGTKKSRKKTRPHAHTPTRSQLHTHRHTLPAPTRPGLFTWVLLTSSGRLRLLSEEVLLRHKASEILGKVFLIFNASLKVMTVWRKTDRKSVRKKGKRDGETSVPNFSLQTKVNKVLRA